MDAVVLARPTKSLTVYIQQSMRPMRPDPLNTDKIATIIDCADNFKRFGLPNFNRNWSLAPNADKEDKEIAAPVKVCPECGKVVPLSTKICDCGYVFYEDEVAEIKQTMVEIPKGFQAYLILAKKNNYKRYWAVAQFIQNDAKTYQELLQVAQFMGYKDAWAWHQWQNVKLRKFR
jgi:superfamily II DNA or RNA helicase